MIISVDFDGTLAYTDFPNILCPRTTVIEFCKAAREMCHILILNTCRTGKFLEEAVQWCREQGLEFDYINTNCAEQLDQWGDCRKIYADIYIDDRNVSISKIETEWPFLTAQECENLDCQYSDERCFATAVCGRYIPITRHF